MIRAPRTWHRGARARGGFTLVEVLASLLLAAIVVFRWYAVVQVGLCVLSCLATEALLALLRRKPVPIGDCSAAVTGVILGLSLPWSAPWYVGFVASFVAIGMGKVLFGGLGQNIFNPAMVGRAFVMICFPAMLGATAYLMPEGALRVVTEATPLTAAKQAAGDIPGLWPLLVGTVNGSLGETSAIACILGGLYLCIRRTASWGSPTSAISRACTAARRGPRARPPARRPARSRRIRTPI